VAILRGGQGVSATAPVRSLAPYKIGCKIATSCNSCIHIVASHSWCQITPVIQSCIMTSGILAPPQRCGHLAGHPKLLQLETPLIFETRFFRSVIYGLLSLIAWYFVRFTYRCFYFYCLDLIQVIVLSFSVFKDSRFYSASAVLSAVIGISSCPSVSPSVMLSYNFNKNGPVYGTHETIVQRL